MEDIVIVNPDGLEAKISEMKKGGAAKLHVLADFDKTLTRTYVNGKLFPSVIWLLHEKSLLSQNYLDRAEKLYATYRPSEIDPHLSYEEKKKLMHEWWTLHFKLLIEAGLNKAHLKQIAESCHNVFRDNASDFFKLLKTAEIPLVVMSSSGLGGDSIEIILEEVGYLSDNIHIISNEFEWDNNGNLSSVKEPIIHSLNKRETEVKDYPVFELIKDRKNVILIGDNAEDTDMIVGFDFENLIKIGFLNEHVEERLEKFKKNYDVIILNDSGMDYINGLVRDFTA
jgi:5'-nucleotidase